MSGERPPSDDGHRELEQLRAALDRATLRAAVLRDLAHELAAADTRLGVARHLAGSLRSVLDSDAGAVWLWDAEAGEIRAVATVGLPEELDALMLSAGVRPAETPELADLLARREPLVLIAGAVTPVLEQMLAALSMKAALGVALLSGDRLLGAVTSSWTHRVLEGVEQEEAVQRLQGVADQAATALLAVELLEQARHQALHDALTRLPNRVLFARRLEDALAEGGAGCVLFGDVDRFKRVNDELGHHAGDEVLREVGARLQALLPPGTTAARLSGDEFAVLLPGADGETGLAVAEAVLAALREPLRLEGRSVHVSMSLGVAVWDRRRARATDLLREADTAMYRAKRAGGSQAVLAGPAGSPECPATEQAADLRAAVPAGQLRLQLQPVWRVAVDGPARVVGAEALVRWQHPQRGLLLPGAFLPLAEEDGTVVEVDLWVLREACREAAVWPDATAEIAVNVAVRTLLDDRFHEAVRTALVDHGLAPSRLQLEVVESRALRDLPLVVQRLTALRHLGVRVALDDFGTGFSTLSWLQELPVDTIKVDRSFTVDTCADDDRRRRTSRALLRGVVAVGAELGVQVLVEGVETDEQLAAVGDAGCDLVQGFLLGRPQDPERLRARVEEGVLGPH